MSMCATFSTIGELHQADGWLDVHALALLAGISRVKASAAMARCHAGGKWRGCRLEIREGHGRGGRSGASYLLAEHTLPINLRHRHRLNAGYGKRDAARRLIVDEVERLVDEHGDRDAVSIVLDRANAGDLLPALAWAGFGPGQELQRAALTRWRREFAELAGIEDLFELEELFRRARANRERQMRERIKVDPKPAAPSIHKQTKDDLRPALVAQAEPDPMPRRIRRVA